MGENRFSMSEALSFGWETMKSNIGFFIGLLIVAFLIQALPEAIGKYTKKDLFAVSVLFYIASWILSFVVKMGLIKVSLKFCDNIKGKLDDLLSSFHLLINYIAGSVLYVLIIIAGTILLIIPGIIWAIKFGLFSYFIVDREMGPVEALKASAGATDGAKWDLFLFGLLLGLINLAGALCFLIGLFATIPTSMVAYAYVYRQLSSNTVSIASETKSSTGGGMHIDLG